MQSENTHKVPSMELLKGIQACCTTTSFNV